MYEIAGYLGVGFYLGSYAALQMGFLSGRGYLYAFLNMIAAALVLTSLMQDFNLFSVIIQVAWITISIIGMSRVYVLNKMTRFSPEEQSIIDAMLSGLSKLEARQVLRKGMWADAKPGQGITAEGEPVENLTWVHTGEIAVSVGGREVAQMGPGSVIGEATCLTEDVATATTTVSQPATLFFIPAAELRALAARNPGIANVLQDSFAAHLRQKLVRSNQAMAGTTGAS